ncbi:unnamed protein product [Phaedon cochleariae]|uniref:Uncharacterized protein n=1 Tax=Phaedon cochleariae TaxID=80249 RepID=A0A9N9SEW9_PHACE|nr:unnamed protein product [Phaedon cochleariae]
MYHGTESDLLRCLDKYITVESKPTDVDAVLIDGAALVDTSKRIDVIWDIYIDKSLKASTREKRGKGKRKLVRENTSIPRNWNDFLRDSENKNQLFDLISNHLKDMPLHENTVVYQHQEQDIWIEFGTGKNMKYISCVEIPDELKEKCLGLPMFHAFTGCDVTSAFFGKGKRKC